MEKVSAIPLHCNGLTPPLIVAADALDDALVAAIDAAQEAGVPTAIIVGLMQGHVHTQTQRMIDRGYR